MRISDWSSDVCSSDLSKQAGVHQTRAVFVAQRTDQQTAEDRHGDRSDRDIGELLLAQPEFALDHRHQRGDGKPCKKADEEREPRSEEHTSELQSLMRISYAVFCLKTKRKLEITCSVSHVIN